jgi:hypothetical protein
VEVDKKEWKKGGKCFIPERTIRGLLTVEMNKEDQTLNTVHEKE